EPITTGVIHYSSSAAADPALKAPKFELVANLVKPNADGAFTLSGLLPGEEYGLFYSDTQNGQRRKLTTITPGKDAPNRLGDVRVARPSGPRIQLRVDGNGNVVVFVNNEQSNSDEDVIRRMMQALSATNGQVQISAEKGVPYEETVHLLNLI